MKECAMIDVTCCVCGNIYEFLAEEKIPLSSGKFYCMDCNKDRKERNSKARECQRTKRRVLKALSLIR